MPVVGIGHGIPRPVGAFGIGEDDPRIAVAIRRITPHVEVAFGAIRRGVAGALKPWMLIGGVVNHQFSNHLQPACMRRRNEGLEIIEGAIHRVDVGVVGNIVAVVAQRRGREGQQPDRGDAQITQVIEAARQSAKVANPIGVAIAECPHVHFINNSIFIPIWLFIDIRPTHQFRLGHTHWAHSSLGSLSPCLSLALSRGKVGRPAQMRKTWAGRCCGFSST